MLFDAAYSYICHVKRGLTMDWLRGTLCFIGGMAAGAGQAYLGLSRGEEDPVVLDEALYEEDSLPQVEETVERRFFVRVIDTILGDTLYYVCRKGPDGDSIPDMLPIVHPSGDTLFYHYYLTGQGDTVLLDFTADQTGEADTVPSWRMDEESEALVDEVARFLEHVDNL